MIVIILCVGVNLNIIYFFVLRLLKLFQYLFVESTSVADYREDALNLLIGLSIPVRLLLSLALFLCCYWCVRVA